MATHTVKQGECLSLIAEAYGLASWRVIYDAPENESFREKRPDPNLIYPGDVLFIPEKDTGDDSASTEQKHRYKVERSRTLVRIKVHGGDRQPLSARKFELTIGNDRYSGQTGSDGLVEQVVNASATTGTLRVHVDSKRYLEWPVELGALDPVEYLTGVQARLKNLGIDPGPIDGIMGPKTERAVRAFQALYPPLAVDGIPGPKTQAKLREVHGC